MKTLTWLPLGLVGAILAMTLGLLSACSTRPIISPSRWEGEARRVTSHPSPPRGEKPAFLQTCATISDHELQEMRGCYDSTYVFGLDIIINPLNSTNPVSINPLFSVPSGSASSPSVTTNNGNLKASFKDGNVSYTVGIGNVCGHRGVFQHVQVTGNGKTVLANTNLTIMIPKTMMPNVARRTRSVVGLGTKGSLVGLHY